MKTLSEYIQQPLLIKRKAFFSFEYDLYAGQEMLGYFRYKRFFGFQGVVEWNGSAGVGFYKEHFWSTGMEIREEGKELPFAKYSRDLFTRSGTIELPGGHKLIIHFSFFDRLTEIKNEAGAIIATLKRSTVFSRNVVLTITEKSSPLDNNPWAIFLAHYLVVKRRQRRRR
jgi:hypothetical protein